MKSMLRLVGGDPGHPLQTKTLSQPWWLSVGEINPFPVTPQKNTQGPSQNHLIAVVHLIILGSRLWGRLESEMGYGAPQP